MNVHDLKRIPPWEWPDSARNTIVAALGKGAKTADRTLAAILSSELSVLDDEIARLLLGIIREPANPEELRAAAAAAFGPVLEHATDEGWSDPEEIVVSEATFREIRQTLRQVHGDLTAPVLVRRRALEASVRSPDDWHIGAIRVAYGTGQRDWRLTAVFCMQYIEGFDREVLESLRTTDPDIHREAVCAAGNFGLEQAWEHVRDLAASGRTERSLRLVAIDALSGIRPEDSLELLSELSCSDDEEIADAASESLAMAEGLADEGDGQYAEDDEGDGDDGLGELDEEEEAFDDGFDDAFGDHDEESSDEGDLDEEDEGGKV